MIHLKSKRIPAGRTVLWIGILGLCIGTGAFGIGLRDRTDRKIDRRIAVERVRTIQRNVIPRSGKVTYAPDRVLVKFRPSFSARSIVPTLRAYGSAKVTALPRIGVYKAQVPAAASVGEFLAALSRNPDVEYAEPDYAARIQVKPDDEYFWRQ
ncbi:MAG: S8 family serine peptidase [Candidatus Aminicenantales bacterium]